MDPFARYIYSKKIQVPLPELFESHMAANKYLLAEMVDDLNGHIKSSLSPANCCIIYDQMLAFKSKLNGPIEESKLKCAALIERNAEEAFKSDTFPLISEQTLISILNFKLLRIPEIDLLKACLTWTDAEVKRRGLTVGADSRRTVFESIKKLIGFQILTLEELGQVEIESYLPTEQVASIFLKLSNILKPLAIDYSTKREIFKLYSVCPKEKFSLLGFTSDPFIVRFSLNANKAAFLDSMSILPTRNARSVTFEISKENQKLLSRSRVCNQEQNLNFHLDRLQMLPGINYKIEFTFQARESCRNCGCSASAITVSQANTLKTENGEFVFQISKINGSFCIQKIKFYPFFFEN